MANPRPRTTPIHTMAQAGRTWVDRVASLNNFRDHVPGDIPTPDNHQLAASTYMTLMYNKHYILSTTHNHAPTDSLFGPRHRLPPPPPTTPPPDPDSNTGKDQHEDPHICGTWGQNSLKTLHSIRSANQGLSRAMYCLAKWFQQSSEIPAQR